MLTRLIDTLSDSSGSIDDALRQMLVVAYRMKSETLKKWTQSELEGYRADDVLPDYRTGIATYYSFHFTGYYGSSARRTASLFDIPEELHWGEDGGRGLRQPVSELVELAMADEDPGVQLPNRWIARYQQLADEGRAATYSGMILDNARILLPRSAIVSLLSNIRTSSLKMALELESITEEMPGPEAGGDEYLRRANRVINVFIENMSGDLNAGDTSTAGSVNISGSDGVANSIQFNNNESSATNVQGDDNTL